MGIMLLVGCLVAMFVIGVITCSSREYTVEADSTLVGVFGGFVLWLIVYSIILGAYISPDDSTTLVKSASNISKL